MQSETSVPTPLSGEEVQEYLVHRVREAFQKSCHLKADNAYTSIKGTIELHLVLNDYGRDQPDNHIVPIELEVEAFQAAADQIRHSTVVDTTTEIKPAPPNQVRIESQQPVPVSTMVDGRRVIKKVQYSSRKAKP